MQVLGYALVILGIAGFLAATRSDPTATPNKGSVYGSNMDPAMSNHRYSGILSNQAKPFGTYKWKKIATTTAGK